jgi:glycosyltransferase involved in cell wall biosynthesis
VTLRETVESALGGTYANVEIVIVDDGSTDGTAQVATELSANPRVRVVRQSNRGLPGALNAALAAARGEFVARLDADDLWHPTKLAKQIARARQMDAPDFIYTFYRYIDAEGQVLFDGPPQRVPLRAFRRSIYETVIGTGSSMLMRRATMEELGGFDESFRNSEDLLFQVKTAAKHKIGFVPEYLVGYRLHPRSLSQDALAMRDVWDQMRRRLKESYQEVPAKVHDWAHARRSMSMAEGFARGRRPKEALLLLWTAVRHDPLWSSAFLTYRAGRWITRTRFRSSNAGRPFLEYNPAEAIDPVSELYGTEGRLMGRLHRRRTRLLAELDANAS